MMKQTGQKIAAIGLLGFLLVLPGCIALALGAGAGAGTAVYLKGDLERQIARDVPTVATANKPGFYRHEHHPDGLPGG